MDEQLGYNVDTFSSSAVFAGARPGWVFKAGTLGVGYYRDDGASHATAMASSDGALHATAMASNPASDQSERPSGVPAPAALLVAPDFVEPFLKACSPGVLLAARETCKAWLETAKRDQNFHWRALTLARYPYNWLQSDLQDECEWLQRYKVLSRDAPQHAAEHEPAMEDEQALAMLKDLQGSYEFFLTAHSLELIDFEGAGGQQSQRWASGDFIFSQPLELRMQALDAEFGEGGGRDVPHGLVLTTKRLDPPLILPYRTYSMCNPYGEHDEARPMHTARMEGCTFPMCKMALNFSIYAKRTMDNSIARMLTLRGCDFYAEGDGYYHWHVEWRHSPAWLKCLTHAEPEAGIRHQDEFEPMLHIGDEDMGDEDMGDDDATIRCSFLKFEFKRRTEVYGGPYGCSYTVPMCVRDMPDIVDQLTWS